MLDVSLQNFHTMRPVLFDGKNVLQEAREHENWNKLYSSLKQKAEHLSELYHSREWAFNSCLLTGQTDIMTCRVLVNARRCTSSFSEVLESVDTV